MKEFRYLKGYFFEEKKRIIIGFFSLLLVDILQLFIPILIGRTVDELTVPQRSHARILQYALGIVLLAFFIALFRFVWRYFLIGTSHKIAEKLRNKFFFHLETLPLSVFYQERIGDLMAHATNDINAIRMAVGMGLVALVDTVFLGIASVVFMMRINLSLTLYALIPMPFIAFSTFYFSKRVHFQFEKVQENFSDMTEMIRESLVGIRIVKAYNQEAKEMGRIKDGSDRFFLENIRLAKISGLYMPLIALLSNLSAGIVIYIGGMGAILSTISLGQFVAFTNYLGILSWPMMALGWMINLMERGSASLGRIQRILSQKPEANLVLSPQSASVPKILKGNIVFKDITLRYPQREGYSLRNLNFSISPGEKVAFVGKTGSGKTTLCNLLLCMVNSYSGEITIDGYPIQDIPLQILRSSIGYVPQDIFLFSDTIMENIAFGRRETDKKRVIELTKAVDIYDEIMSFPMGLETQIGERGITLSGGQKQRIALARALLLDTPILILDDCFSHLDSQTEARILQNIDLLLKGKTTIVVSHRISAIKEFERIYVLEEGEIKEEGDHLSLFKKNGIYTSIYMKQEIEKEMETLGNVS